MEINPEIKGDDNIDLQAIAEGEQNKEVIVQEDEVVFTELEQKAHDDGWRPESDFNGKEGNWKTAKEFINDGKFITQINSLKQQIDHNKSDFDTRMENANKLHDARILSEIKQLKKEQRADVSTADEAGFDEKQAQIEELQSQVVEEKPKTKTEETKDPTIAAWENKNPWIKDPDDERMEVAQGIFKNYLNKNPTATNEQALAHIDTRIAKLYPSEKINPRREQVNTTENNGKPARRTNKTLTMSDLTPAERNDWDTVGRDIFSSEADFLKTVTDTRTK